MSWANSKAEQINKQRLMESERDLLLEKIGKIDVQLAEAVWSGSMGGHDPEFNKLKGGLKRFWIEKAATSPHPFTYCVRHLRKHVANPERLCFAPGTRVLTRDRGLVKIEDLVPGQDMVMTHKGRWRTVAASLAIKATSPVVSFMRKGYDRPLTVTKDHPLLIADGVPFMLDTRVRHRSKALREAVGIDGPHRHDDGRYAPVALGTVEWREAGRISGREYLLAPFEVEDVDLELSDDMLKLIGLWLAEGTGYNQNRVRFCFGIDEPLVAECMEALEREFGRQAKVHRHPTSDVVSLSDIADDMYRWVSGAKSEKMMDGRLLLLPAERLRILIDAYLAGDGHVRPDRNEAVATTISETLAHQVAFALQRLGHHANIRQARSARVEFIEGRQVQASDTWTVSFSPDEGRRSGLSREGMIGYDIRDVSETAADVVYDIEVDEDHSLLAEGVIASNCAWLKDQALGTTKWRKGGKITEAANNWQPGVEELRSALMAYVEAATELGLIVEGDNDSGEAAPVDAPNAGGAPDDGGQDGTAAESEGTEAEGEGSEAAATDPAGEAEE